MCVLRDVLQRKLCCTVASVFEIHNVAVPCAPSCREAGRELEEAGLYWGGGVSACTIPSVMLDLSLAKCRNLHGAARLQSMMGGRDSLVSLLSEH